MKIVFDKNDIYKTLGSLNNKTFMAASYVNSKEAWGLPTFRRLRFKKEADIWKDTQVNAALDAVKKYAQKKGWKIATPAQSKEDAKGLFKTWSTPGAIAEGAVAKCANPRFVTAKGVVLAAATCTFEHDKKAVKKVGIYAGSLATAATASLGPAAILGSVLGTALGVATGTLLVHLTYKGNAALLVSYVPFVKPNGKIVWKKFGFFLIGEYKAPETPTTSAESIHSQSLEADNDDVNVDMNDLVDNAECPIEDAGKDSETVDVSKISEATAAHNEEASAGGVVISEKNADDLTMDPVTGEESLFTFSFESLDDDEETHANTEVPTTSETPTEETTTEPEIPVETPDTNPETDDLANSGVDVTALDDAAAKVADIGDTNVAANVIPGEVVDTSTEALNVELLGWDLD